MKFYFSLNAAVLIIIQILIMLQIGIQTPTKHKHQELVASSKAYQQIPGEARMYRQTTLMVIATISRTMT